MATLAEDIKKTAKTKLVRQVSRAVFGRGLVGGAIGRAFEKKFGKEQDEDTRVSEALREQSSLQDQINSTVVRIESIVTNIADNVYNIAGVLNAQITSMEEARREQRERFSRQQAAEEEAANEASRVAAPATTGSAEPAGGDKKGVSGILSSILGTVKNTRKLFGGFLKKFAVIAGAAAVAGGAAYAASSMTKKEDTEEKPTAEASTPQAPNEQSVEPESIVQTPTEVAPSSSVQQPNVQISRDVSPVPVQQPSVTVSATESSPSGAVPQPKLEGQSQPSATQTASATSDRAGASSSTPAPSRREIQTKIIQAQDSLKQKQDALYFAEKEINELQQEWPEEKTKAAEKLAKENKPFSVDVNSPLYPNEFKQIDDKYTKHIGIKKAEAARTRTEISSIETVIDNLSSKLPPKEEAAATPQPAVKVSAPPPAAAIVVPAPTTPAAPTAAATATAAPTAAGSVSPSVSSTSTQSSAGIGSAPSPENTATPAPAAPSGGSVQSAPTPTPSVATSPPPGPMEPATGGASFVPPPVSSGSTIGTASREVAAAAEMPAPKSQLIETSSTAPVQGTASAMPIPSPIADRGTLDQNTMFDAGM